MLFRIALIAFLHVTLSALAEKPSQADLAIRSRAILVKHCAGCHGEKPTRNDLKVLVHSQLLEDRKVAFVKSKEPTASQALELIEEGSMPPGRHEKVTPKEIDVLRDWVAGGAAAYPVRFDDEFAYATILSDVEKAGPDAAASYRYLSLHHLATDDSTADLGKARAEFLATVGTVLKAGVVPVPLDPTATIFRIDLTKAGWHHKPFKKLNAKGEDAGPAEGNLFDVVLLEYPLAPLPENSPSFDKLGTAFLQPARQVRPFAFIHGDWFAEAATSSPLADDLRILMGLFEEVPPGLMKPKSNGPIMSKPAGVPAVDTWHGADPQGEPAVKGLKVGTIDFSLNKPRDRFAPNDRFRLRVSADEPMYFQVLWVDSAGRVDTRTNVEAYDPAKGPKDIPLPDDPKGLGDELGRERLTVFASTKPFAQGEAWRAKHETKTIERFVHPFFALKKRGDALVPDTDTRIARKTVFIEIAKSDK